MTRQSTGDAGVDARAADADARLDGRGADAFAFDARARAACGDGGSLVGSCLTGPCDVVASGICGTQYLTVEGASVYWADDTRGDVMRAPAGGGSQAPLTSQPVASLEQRFIAVAADTSAAYYAISEADGVASIFRIPFAGGTPILLVNDPSGVAAMVATGTSIVWANLTGDLRQVSVDGGATKTLTTGLELSTVAAGSVLAVDSAYVYWLNWAKLGDTAVMKVPIGGGLPMTLAPTAWPVGVTSSGGMRIIVYDANVYWSVYGDWQGSNGSVLSVPLGGGETTTLASGLTTPAGIVSDGMNVYWVSDQHGDVLGVPASGGTVSTLASGQDHPPEIALDATHVYWSTLSRIERTPK